MRVQVAVPYLKGRLDELYKRTSGHSTRSWLADLTASPSAQSADVNSTGLSFCSLPITTIIVTIWQGLYILLSLSLSLSELANELLEST